MVKSQRIIIKDPLYKVIFLDREHKQFLDSPEFQRLRFIKQTSFASYVYPNANHTRFTHSLGAYHLMNKVFENNLMEVSKKDKNDLVLAALLHDIGHGPFSHLWEQVFPHFDHEKATREILMRWGLKDVAKVLEGNSPYYYLISSTIDVDKLDYMARDSYFAGVSYGVAEVDFIIERMYVENFKLVIKPSSISSVEDLITQRVNLFKTVYFHKFSVEYDFLFVKIFQRVKELLDGGKEVFVDPHLMAFFEKKNSIDDLLALNDFIIMYHLNVWSKNDDKILSDLASMFMLRKKFKVVNLNQQKVDIKKLRKKVAKKYDERYYFGEVCLPIKIIQTPIYVEFDGKFRKLSEFSELIKFYNTQNWNMSYVIFPKDIEI